MKQTCLFLNTCIRLLKCAGTVTLMIGASFAQNPVPQIVGPPSPQAVAPGGADFTLKVYGANFVPGSVVNWNRQPRATTYISGHEVDATILSSDIVANTAGYITVTNPLPGGGVSSASWTLVEVHNPTPTIAPGDPKLYLSRNGGAVAHLLVADFNNDGIMDLAEASNNLRIPILTGDGTGNFKFSHMASYVYWENVVFNNVTYGDFNGDGNLDLAYQGYFGFNNPTGLDTTLGQGDGSFKPGWHIDDGTVIEVLAGDFDRDGKLDLIVGDCCHTKVYLGNGDGTFRLFKTYSWGGYRLIGDLNGDGKLDLLVMSDTKPAVLNTVVGNGDGTFQPPKGITAAFDPGGCSSSLGVQVSDFNNDGILDVAFCTTTSIGVALGNVDGTFQKPKFYFADTQPQFSFTVGDFNSDGKVDLLVSLISSPQNTSFILLGNGDGTFQPKQVVAVKPKGSDGEFGIAVGDFNSDGLLDFVFQEGGYGFAEYLQRPQ